MKNIIGTVRMPEGHEELKEWLRDAHKQGINWIDTAFIYGSGKVEKRLGVALRKLKEEGIEFKIQTKIWTTHFKDVKNAFNAQLESLQMDKVDALLLHRPSINFWDSVEAWKDLIDLKAQGLVDEIGVSNFEAEMIDILVGETKVKPTINQIELSITNWREDRVFFNNKYGIEIQAWSIYGVDVKANMNNPLVVKIAKAHNVKSGTILSSYLTSQGIIPLHASLNKDHLADSINTIELSKEEIKELRTLNKYINKYEVSYPY